MRIAALALLSLTPALAPAQSVLYSTPRADNAGGVSVSQARVYSSFSIIGAKALTSFTWDQTLVGPGSASFGWSINQGGESTPGATLYSGVATDVMGSLYSWPSVPTFTNRSFTVDLPSLALEGGTYWLGIFDFVDPQWSGGGNWGFSPGGPCCYAYTPDEGANWGLGRGSMSFSISGTDAVSVAPEPASMALFGTGLIALGVAMRRTRR